MLRACVRMPVQAVRVVQSGVDILHARAAALATRPPEEVDSSTAQPHLGKGWKSGKLRDAIRGGCLASAATAPVAQTKGDRRKVEDLETMIRELQAQLSAKEKSLATCEQPMDPASSSASGEYGAQAAGCLGSQQPVARRLSSSAVRRKCSAQLQTPEARCKDPADLPKPSVLPHPARDAAAVTSAGASEAASSHVARSRTCQQQPRLTPEVTRRRSSAAQPSPSAVSDPSCTTHEVTRRHSVLPAPGAIPDPMRRPTPVSTSNQSVLMGRAQPCRGQSASKQTTICI